MAEFEKRLACVIAADGSIARGYMIDKCELKGANEYVITWKVPLQKEAKTNFSCVIGSANEEDVEPGLCTVGLMADANKMHVRTYDVAGKPAKRPFHLACFRELVDCRKRSPLSGLRSAYRWPIRCASCRLSRNRARSLSRLYLHKLEALG